MQTFTTTLERYNFMLKTKNHEAAQNVRCTRPECGQLWKEHFAGDSRSIPQGACLIDIDVVYSQE